MSATYLNAQSYTGVTTLTVPASALTCWNCTSLEISQAGPTTGPNAVLTVWDGAVNTGTIIYRRSLSAPTGSVGMTEKINIPTDARGLPCLQSLPGNAMNIVVTGTGANLVNINARVQDGLGS